MIAWLKRLFRRFRYGRKVKIKININGKWVDITKDVRHWRIERQPDIGWIDER